MTEYVIINGHHPTCAYIRTLHWDDQPDDCDCQDDGPDHDDLAPFDDDFEADLPGDYSEELVEALIAGWFQRYFGASSVRQRDRECAREIMSLLAGRLVPEGSEVREEWMVWHQRPGGVEACHLVDGDGTFTDEEWARQHAAEDPPSEVRQRRVITTPWTPAEPAQEENRG